MGNSNRSGPDSAKRSTWVGTTPYLLAVCFGVLAVSAGGVACENPLIGVAMLSLVMIGYISAAVLLSYVTGAVHGDEGASFHASGYPDAEWGGRRQAAVIPVTTTTRRYR